MVQSSKREVRNYAEEKKSVLIDEKERMEVLDGEIKMQDHEFKEED